MIIQIPFSGFYESIHNSNIDSEMDYIFENNQNLSSLLYDSLNWRELFIDYAREYAENFAHKYGIAMQFESLSSPKYYNFETDRIFCHISESEVLRIYATTDKQQLARIARDMFTSRDGFNSFYDPDYLTWDSVLTWDHNQLFALIVAFTDFDESEIYLMDDSLCNGFMSELLYKHCSDKRIFTVFDYLQSRENRKAA